MKVHEIQKPRVPGQIMGGQDSAGHGAIWGPGAHAGSRSVQLRTSNARNRFDIRGRDRAVQSIALQLVAPDARCAEKKVR